MKSETDIREIVESLTLDQARFCLWVMRDGDDGTKNPTNHPKPTKKDEKLVARLLKLPHLK